MMGPKSKWA